MRNETAQPPACRAGAARAGAGCRCCVPCCAPCSRPESGLATAAPGSATRCSPPKVDQPAAHSPPSSLLAVLSCGCPPPATLVLRRRHANSCFVVGRRQQSRRKAQGRPGGGTHLDLILALCRLAVLVLLLCRDVEAAVLDDLGEDLRVDVGHGDGLVAANLCSAGERARRRAAAAGRRRRQEGGVPASSPRAQPSHHPGQSSRGLPRATGRRPVERPAWGPPSSVQGPCSRDRPAPAGPAPSMVFWMVTLCLATSASTSNVWVSELSSFTCGSARRGWSKELGAARAGGWARGPCLADVAPSRARAPHLALCHGAWLPWRALGGDGATRECGGAV